MPFKCTYLQALQARKLDVPNLLLVRAYVSCCIVRDKKSLVPYVRLPFSIESTPCKESLPPPPFLSVIVLFHKTAKLLMVQIILCPSLIRAEKNFPGYLSAWGTFECESVAIRPLCYNSYISNLVLRILWNGTLADSWPIPSVGTCHKKKKWEQLFFFYSILIFSKCRRVFIQFLRKNGGMTLWGEVYPLLPVMIRLLHCCGEVVVSISEP